MAQDLAQPSTATPALHVAPSPHLGVAGRSTKWMMYDVIIALLPAVAVSFYVFGADAGRVLALSVGACAATEAIFAAARGRRVSLPDGSAVVTGLILAFSLPWTSPWWIPVIAGGVAIALGKMVFGGLGGNVFNPAMVGRAFVMISFTTEVTTYLTAGGQGPPGAFAHAMTGATPLAAAKYEQVVYPLHTLLLGNINGSLGETSALALLIGGLYLCVRRSAAWQIPAGVLAGAMVVALISWAAAPATAIHPLYHLLGGGLMLGAFFIATDPVSSPVSVRGRWVFGVGVGVLTMVIRLFAAYPEGVMFSILLMNSVTPIINRLTIPTPVGGKPKPKPAA